VIYPAYYEVVIPNQATFEQEFQLKGGDGQPLNMTGYQVRASVWTEDKKAKLADFEFEWVDRMVGKFKLSLSEEKTSRMTKSGVWDLLVVNPNATEDYWLRGPANVAKGYTK